MKGVRLRAESGKVKNEGKRWTRRGGLDAVRRGSNEALISSKFIELNG